MPQHTIKHAVTAEGVGLHSGKNVKMVLQPAPENTGIVFRRHLDDKLVSLPMQYDRIVEAPMCTQLVYDDIRVSTTEHLMAAFAAMGVDNIYVDLDSAEVPVMDGSSAPFIFLLETAGLEAQVEAPRRYIKIMQPVRVEDDDKFAELLPYAKGYCLHITVDFPHPVIQATSQEVLFDFSRKAFVKSVSRARTFGYANQLEHLHNNNLALGASLDNAVGIGDKGILNPEGLRYKDEFVRHKLLDCIGDLYVAGPIRGMFRGHKMGHALNNRLLHKLLTVKKNYEIFED